MLIRQFRNPQQQSALLRRIVDRIQNSLELSVVLQTAVDEVAALLNLDRCLFFWYFQDSKQIQVVCEHLCDGYRNSYIGEYTLADWGCTASLLQAGEVIVCPSAIRNHWLIDWLHRFQNPYPYLYPSRLKMLGTDVNLLVPVKGQANSIGFIVCLGDRPRRWSTSEVEFMQAIAQRLEIAIRQAQLYEQTRKQARQEQLINQITTLTRQSFDLNAILTEAIAQIFEALSVDRCLVHLVEDLSNIAAQTARAPLDHSSTVLRQQHLYEVCRSPFAPSIDTFDTHGPITQWVIQHRQQVAIANITQDPRIGADNSEYQSAQIRSSLVIPVQTAGQLHAILYLNQCAYTRHWSKDDCKLAQAVADQLAISIRQALLYAQMQKQAIESAAQAQHLAETLDHLRQAQAQLIRSEKLSSLGQLVAGLAHEINNPISFIYGNIPYLEHYIEDLVFLIQCYQKRSSGVAEGIKEEYPEPSQLVDLEFVLQDLPRLIHSLKAGATRVREIVQSLRSFSNLDKAQRRTIDIHQEIGDVLTLLHPQIGTEIQVIEQYGTLPAIQGYPTLLHQTLVHLVMNAIEALNHPPSASQLKTIVITTAPFSNLKTAAPWIRISIIDNGCGIPANIQPKIFDPFFTTKQVGQGTGLGLAICYHAIVNHHQGHFSFQSHPSRGSEFIVELPVKSTAPYPRSDSASGSPAGSSPAGSSLETANKSGLGS